MPHSRYLDYCVRILAGSVMLALALNAGSDIEQIVAPVARDVSSRPVSRTDDVVCWDFSFVKLREGYPWRTSWSMMGETASERASVWVYDPATLETISREKTTRPGQGTITYRRCAVIPFSLRDDPVLYIDGFVTYDVWHRLWRLERVIPRARIDLPISTKAESGR